MISDEKALRAAELIKRYCGERGCDDGECAFRLRCGVCIIQATRLPEDWKLDGLKPRETSQQTR
jgi:hypothetical protein